MELKIQSLGNIQEQEEEEEEEGEDEEEKEEEKHFHVLAVDDSVLDRKILERLLRISSYKVTCVESGDKALQYLGLLDNLQTTPSPSSSSSSATSSPSSSPQLSNVEGLKVNLIMTDYCMPGMNGYDLLRRIKGSTWKDVPVIVMSSENVPARVTMCLEGGAEEFLLKPLQLSDLEKLQPHLLKSLNQPTPAQTRAPAGKDNAVAVKSGNNVSKRKAMSPKPSGPDRRPKMKELTVV